MAKTPYSISVFFPCFNDEKSIKALVESAYQTLALLTRDYEVIVVNDGSTDSSAQVLVQLTKRYPNLRIITHATNKGYGGALKSGLEACKKDLIFYTDGDGQYDVAELADLVGLLSDDIDVVNGIKLVRNDPTYRVLLGNTYSFVARWLFWLPIYDVDCDFRLIRRSVFEGIKLTSTSGSVCIELVKCLARRGARFRQVSVHHYERKYGSSQFFRPSRLLSTFVELCSLWFKLMVFKY